VQCWVRVGLLAPRSAVILAVLPRGNQCPVGEIVTKRGLTVGQTQLLVSQLLEATDDKRQELMVRWREQGPVPAQGGARPALRKARSEVEWMSTDIITLHRTAARLQARLMGNALCAAPDAVRHLMTESLLALVPVLHSLAGVIADSACSPEAGGLG
jgi:hypothetical protein